MTRKRLDVIDATVHLTYEWLGDIAVELGDERRHVAYLALRGTLHAVRDFIPLAESAQLSAQLPMLVRGIYFEGWSPTRAADHSRSREEFLRRVETALERAMWNELEPMEPEQAARAVLRVITARVSAGEIDHVRQAMPERVRGLWPPLTATG